MIRVATCLIGMFSVSALFGLSIAVGEEIPDITFSTPFPPGKRPTTANFKYNGRAIGEGREAFEDVIKRIRALPVGSSIVWGPNYARCGACSGREPACLPKHLYPDLWKELETIAAEHRLTLSSAYPEPEIIRTRLSPRTEGPKDTGLTIDWSNFHGPATPHEEVLYFANDKYLGRGDEGFDLVLKRVGQMPPNAQVTLPRYKLTGRYATEGVPREEIDARNAKLRDLIPFGSRKPELDAKLTERKLEPIWDDVIPNREARTVADWDSGDRYAYEIASFGRIIHHDEQPQRTAARLGWTRYDANERRKRKLETDAVYTLDDVELGEGVAGFAKAMQKLMNLPEGSVVQVQVCIRTKGNFLCPLIYEGQRHFERTGYEPYFGMFRWLIDVAQKRKLKIEWLPDERESCQDCELNK